MYKCVVADQPWTYKNKKTGGSLSAGSASKYDTLTLDEIKALNIKSIVDKDCALFLWATVPLLDEAFEVMKDWGFKYKTTIFWHKTGINGLGYWYRGQVEPCLFGIRGKVKAFRIQKPNIFQSKPRGHSIKPEEIYDYIPEELKPKIELFARTSREGWDVLGQSIDGKDIRDIL